MSGRVFNVLGQPVDRLGPVESDIYYPIHRPAPEFSEQSTRVEVFETGVKVIDLIAPFTKGGKRGSLAVQGLLHLVHRRLALSSRSEPWPAC